MLRYIRLAQAAVAHPAGCNSFKGARGCGLLGTLLLMPVGNGGAILFFATALARH